MVLSSKDKIVKAVHESYLKNKARLTKFFSDNGFDKLESVNLAHTMRNAVYFLEIHEYKRDENEQIMRYEIRRQLKAKKKDIEMLIEMKDTLADMVHHIDWDLLFELELKLIDEHLMMKTRAGKNKSLAIALEPLFWKLKMLGCGQTQQVDIVHNLFKEFQLDDYAREPYHTKNQLIGHKEKSERIRKQFQQPAMKSREEYARLFGWPD